MEKLDDWRQHNTWVDDGVLKKLKTVLGFKNRCQNYCMRAQGLRLWSSLRLYLCT